MTPLTDIRKLNEELADRINQEALANPQSPYAGKFVGIANGQVVAVADTLHDAICLLRQVEPVPERTQCIEASRDYSEPECISESIWWE
jgi:hypothetical protein